MKKVNWVEVEEATNVDWLPQGGYVIEIVDVDDVPSYEYLNIVFDVVEGEYAHKFAEVPKDKGWTHQLRQSYGEKSERFFKGFLTALEKSNPGFSISEWQAESDETKLIGLKLGAVINYYHYVNEKGVASKKYNFARPMSVDKIRSGDFKVPDDQWSDDAKALEESTGGNTSATSTGGKQKQLYADCPF